MAEVWAAILASPMEKAPGPDDFTRKFYHSCWPVIKEEVMVVFNRFYKMAGSNFVELNSALIALVPKKNDASELSHYSPISLIHSVAKLISKVLALRLSSALNGVISLAQTAFQKGKCIHDNFSMCKVVSECFIERKSRPCSSNSISLERLILYPRHT